MGNQIVCPAANDWYASDLKKVNLSVDGPLFDGTFLLSLKGMQTDIHRSRIIKAFQIYEGVSIDELKKYQEYFINMTKGTIDGHIFFNPHLTKTGAYLVREYLDSSIIEAYEQGISYSPIEKDWIAFQFLRAIRNLHQSNFYHGDIKPENVFVDQRLTVQIVDHAPYKPYNVNPYYTHFLIHFFSYVNGRTCIAPERINVEPSKDPDFFKADIFSCGCVLLYIYTGEHLFSFTSLQAYKDGDKSTLKLLEKVGNTKAKQLIESLLSLDLKKRVDTFQSFEKYFPTWFPDFYTIIKNNRLESPNIETMRHAVKQIYQAMPQKLTNEIVIYFNMLADSLLHEGTGESLFLLLRHYVDLSKHFDQTGKLTRCIPPLFELFNRKVTIISQWTYDAILSILAQVNEIPDSLEGYIPRYLIHSFKSHIHPGWGEIFDIYFPQLLVTLSRLWKNMKLPLSVLQPLMYPLYQFKEVRQTANEIPKQDIDKKAIAIVHSFMVNCKDATLSKNHGIIDILMPIVSVLGRSPFFIEDMLDFVKIASENIGEGSKKHFLKKSLDDSYPSIIYFLRIDTSTESLFYGMSFFVKNNIASQQQISEVIPFAIEKISSPDHLCRNAAKSFINSLDPFWRRFYVCTWFMSHISDPKLDSKILVDYRKSTYSADGTIYRSNTRNRLITNQQEGINVKQAAKKSRLRFGKKKENIQQITQGENYNNTFYSAMRFGNGPISEIQFADETNLVFCHSSTNLAWAQCPINTHTASVVKQFNLNMPIKSVLPFQNANHVNHAIALAGSVMTVLNVNGVVTSKELSKQYLGVKFMNEENYISYNSNSIDLCNFETLAPFSSIQLPKDDIISVEPWEDKEFATIFTRNKEVVIYDLRTNFPIRRNKHADAHKIIPLPYSLSYASIRSNTIRIFDASEQKTTFGITGFGGYAFSSTPNLYLLDKYGAYSFNAEYNDECHSYLASGQVSSISVNDNEKDFSLINLPQHNRLPLHSHLYPVSSANGSSTGLIVSGDVKGFVHFWQPVEPQE